MTADHITVSHQRLVAAGVAERSAAEPSARCLCGGTSSGQHARLGGRAPAEHGRGTTRQKALDDSN